jgi:hypothetical protein
MQSWFEGNTLEHLEVTLALTRARRRGLGVTVERRGPPTSPLHMASASHNGRLAIGERKQFL